MSMINQEISDFRTYAFHKNDFKFVSREDILGKWSVFFFYPADFTSISFWSCWSHCDRAFGLPV